MSSNVIDICDSDQTWTGNTVISASQSLLFRGCTLTVVDGNITVYGSLTLENSRIMVLSSSPSNMLTISGQGSLTLYNSTIISGPSEYFVCSTDNSRVTVNSSRSDYQGENLAWVAMGSSKVQIYRSCLLSIESRDASTVEIYDSTIGSISPMPIEEVSLWSHGNSIVITSGSIYHGVINITGNSEAIVTNSTVKDVECRGNSRTMVSTSILGHASIHDNSTLYLNGIGVLGMMTDFDAYSNSFSLWPRVHIYDCSLGAVRVWGEGRSELNIAHSIINDVQTRGNVALTYNNMTVTGEWTHNGEMVWWRREFDHIGNFCIEWGGTNASGVIVSGTAGKIEKRDTTFGTPPAPIPPSLSGVYCYVYLSYMGEFTAQMKIHYNDEQVATIEPSSLRLYSYTTDKGWQQLDITGVNETGKYVWGNITHEGGMFSACFAALGSPKTNGQPPTLAGGMDWWAMAPYIGFVAIALAAAGAAVYYRWFKGKK
ncbi:MAG: hypothetical protein QXX77_00740 [Candidatus Methanosuratincola sp.]